MTEPADLTPGMRRLREAVERAKLPRSKKTTKYVEVETADVQEALRAYALYVERVQDDLVTASAVEENRAAVRNAEQRARYALGQRDRLKAEIDRLRAERESDIGRLAADLRDCADSLAAQERAIRERHDRRQQPDAPYAPDVYESTDANAHPILAPVLAARAQALAALNSLRGYVHDED